jgi:hypothetical protein
MIFLGNIVRGTWQIWPAPNLPAPSFAPRPLPNGLRPYGQQNRRSFHRKALQPVLQKGIAVPPRRIIPPQRAAGAKADGPRQRLVHEAIRQTGLKPSGMHARMYESHTESRRKTYAGDVRKRQDLTQRFKGNARIRPRVLRDPGRPAVHTWSTTRPQGDVAFRQALCPSGR